MSNRTDFKNVAGEIFDATLRDRIEIELHNAFVAGQEDQSDIIAALEKERDGYKLAAESVASALDKVSKERDELRAFVKIIAEQGSKPNGMMDSAFGLVPNQVRQAATELLDRTK